MHLLATLYLATMASASLTIIPGGEPRAFTVRTTAVTTPDTFFRKSATGEFTLNSTKVLMSSFDDSSSPFTTSADVHPSTDSFVRGAIQAWGEHQHLVIRPD